MARLKCECGNGMNNSNDPSENIINVYKKSDVDEALKENSKIRLIDFEMMDWDYEYWYCPICKRIHKVENESCGNVVEIYTTTDEATTYDKNCKWEEYYAFLESETYEAEEHNTTLRKFIQEFGDTHLYWFDSQNNTIYKEDINGNFKQVYKTEK